MHTSTTPCCAHTLQQQREQVTQYAEQDKVHTAELCEANTKKCTVVENGRVVVKKRTQSNGRSL